MDFCPLGLIGLAAVAVERDGAQLAPVVGALDLVCGNRRDRRARGSGADARTEARLFRGGRNRAGDADLQCTGGGPLAGLATSAGAGSGGEPATRMLAHLMEPRSPLVDELVAVGWMVSSALLILWLAIVAHRYADARLEWPDEEIEGVLVHVSPAAGPAVFGFFKPWIAVPAWLLDRPLHEQRLVVGHEKEHLRGGDHYLMAAAWLIVALMPWNVAAWWMVARLRLAIELDCDRRMVRRGVSVHTYGLLLIDVASEYRGLSLGATAFASRPSQLERRIRAMRPGRNRFAAWKGAFLVVVAAGAMLLVKGTPLPRRASFQLPPMRADIGWATSRWELAQPEPRPTWGLGAYGWALFAVDTATIVASDSSRGVHHAKPSAAGRR